MFHLTFTSEEVFISCFPDLTHEATKITNDLGMTRIVRYHPQKKKEIQTNSRTVKRKGTDGQEAKEARRNRSEDHQNLSVQTSPRKLRSILAVVVALPYRQPA